ncbi:MAG: hypothetical protein JF614_11780 [Acidobacteria bacterium]|nr:hypothetical protein [Acidobacteriota bacterium]
MSKTGVSIVAYSIYLGSGGLGMALIPNVLLGLLGLPPTPEPWIRLFGFLALVLAAKGINGALLNLVPVMQFDVYTRICFSLFLTALIVLGLAPRIMFIFAAIDFAAAVWTQVTLVAAKRRAVSTAT